MILPAFSHNEPVGSLPEPVCERGEWFSAPWSGYQIGHADSTAHDVPATLSTCLHRVDPLQKGVRGKQAAGGCRSANNDHSVRVGVMAKNILHRAAWLYRVLEGRARCEMGNYGPLGLTSPFGRSLRANPEFEIDHCAS